MLIIKKVELQSNGSLRLRMSVYQKRSSQTRNKKIFEDYINISLTKNTNQPGSP